MIKINIASEFSKLPGPRYIKEGDHSGELFRETLLRPRFEQARKAGEKLIVELDGVTFGYPSSFLEESFGGVRIPSRLNENIEHDAILVHRPPKVILYALDANEHLVHIPLIPRPRPAAAHAVTELPAPAPNRIRQQSPR